jgi:hypothetical protein
MNAARAFHPIVHIKAFIENTLKSLASFLFLVPFFNRPKTTTSPTTTHRLEKQNSCQLLVMSEADLSVVGEVLEQVITNTVSQEEHESLARVGSITPVSSLDYGDEIGNIDDDFKENQAVENEHHHPKRLDSNGDASLNEVNGRSSNDDDMEVIDDAPEYVVEKIVEKKINSDGAAEYQVKWKNYPSGSNTWEPAENLADCDQLMQQFEIKSAEALAEKHASEEDEQVQANQSVNKRKQKHPLKEYEVNDVMGLTVVGKEKYFLVSLSNSTQKTFIRASLANRIIPQKVIDFYIKSMKWKQV